MLVDASWRVQSVSAVVTRALHHDPERVCGQLVTDLVVEAERPLLAHALEQASHEREPIVVEVSMIDAAGSPVPFELTVVSLLDDPTVGGFVVSGHDITRLRAAHDALMQLAHYDALTGLANRRTFDTDLQREWTLTSRDGIDSYVVVMDVDGFKTINDNHGHAAGDDALRHVAHALRSITRDTDIVARIGGDEFAVVLVRCGGAEAATGFERRLADVLAHRLFRTGQYIRVSSGHQSLRHSTSPDDALHQADVAMLANKRQRADR
jgi:diguanylate cyclase (GGDEF)-like protein/PAS domain S-box-containing protein